MQHDSTEPPPDNSGYTPSVASGLRPEGTSSHRLDATATYEFPPGYLERATATIQGAHAAASDPLPGPLLEAFLPEPLRAAGLELRAVVASDWPILKKLDSPILKELQGLALNPELPKPEVVYEEEDVWELLYLWTHPVREVRALLAKGRQQFREEVLQRTADTFPAGVVNDRGAILTALATNLFRSISTRIGHKPAGEDGPDFRSAPPKTASVGG